MKEFITNKYRVDSTLDLAATKIFNFLNNRKLNNDKEKVTDLIDNYDHEETVKIAN